MGTWEDIHAPLFMRAVLDDIMSSQQIVRTQLSVGLGPSTENRVLKVLKLVHGAKILIVKEMVGIGLNLVVAL